MPCFELKELHIAREALVKDRTAAKNRAKTLTLSLLRKHNAQRLDQIERQIQAIETAILATIEADADLASRFAILTRASRATRWIFVAFYAGQRKPPASSTARQSGRLLVAHSFGGRADAPAKPSHASPRRSSLQSGHEGQIHTPHRDRKTRESRPHRYHAKARRPRKRPPKVQSPMDAKNCLINTDTLGSP